MEYPVESCHQFLRILIHGNPQADYLYGFLDENGRKLLQMDFLSDFYDMLRSIVNQETQAEFVNRMRYMGDKK